MTVLPIDLFDEMLQLTTTLFFEQENELFFRFLEKESSTLIDVGCGNGDYLSRLHDAYPDLSLTGLEYEAGIFKKAVHKQTDRLNFYLSSYESASIEPSSAGAIVARLVMQHISDRIQFAEWAYKCMVPGGRLLLLDVDDNALQLNDRLPLFSQLYVQSRQSIQLKSWLSFADQLKLEMTHTGFTHSRTERYRLKAEDRETKRKLYRYMICVTELYTKEAISKEREEELTAWLHDDSCWHEIHMFGLEFQKR
ncbi:class I SAM-dependent methyltransferase [Paenibacillus gorillae]|uniref:class I SAM-dependent methyltransferase n=1 Tax=Paenibacillus gorillae TaxID=1243662 RepID=UPI0004B444C6|nr:class I SAM-dependent methyltransferase [Paenibacillus gorillae]